MKLKEQKIDNTSVILVTSLDEKKMKSKEEKIREYLAEKFKHGSKVDLTVSKKGKKATLIIGGILNNLMARVIFDYISGLGIDIEYAVENKQSTKKEQSKDIAEIINERIYNIKNGLSNDLNLRR